LSNRTGLIRRDVEVRSHKEVLPALSEEQRERLRTSRSKYRSISSANKSIRTSEGDASHSEGYEAGFEAGMEAALAEHRELLAENLQELLSAIETDRGNLQDRFEGLVADLVEKAADLSIEIAETILHQELQIDRSAVLPIVCAALKGIRGGAEIRIKINAADRGLLEAHYGDLKACVPQAARIEIVRDDSIAAGCFIETESGDIDATVEGMHDVLSQELRLAA